MKKGAARKRVNEIADKYKNNPRKGITELKKILKEGQEKNDTVLIGLAYNALAVKYYDLGKTDAVFSNALKAVAFLEKTEEYEGLSTACINLGYGYSEQENDQMALAILDKAYHIMKTHRVNKANKATLLNNLADIYHQMGDCKTAIKYEEQALELMVLDDPNDYTSKAMYTINLAEFYYDNKQPDKTEELFESMVPWLDQIGFKALVCDFYLRRAILDYELGKKKIADKYLDEALKYIPKDMYPHPIYDDLRQVIHFTAGSGDKVRSSKIADLMEVYADVNKGNMERFIALRALADYHGHVGDPKKACELYFQVDEIFEERMKELKQAQYNIQKYIKDADEEIRRLNRKMKAEYELASKEPLTGLLNRSALLKISDEFITNARKRKEKIGAIFIDIDFFKECNDTYGHAKGDEIIKEVANVCKAQETGNIRFARYGGDEFFGLTKGLSDKEVTAVAAKICNTIRKEKIPNEKNPNGGIVTLSSGVANVKITDRIDSIIDIANFADKALYYAKNNGKNSIYLLDYESSKPANNSTFVKI